MTAEEWKEKMLRRAKELAAEFRHKLFEGQAP